MRDFPSKGLWPFPDVIFYLFVGELVEDNGGKLVGFSSVKDVDLIQCNLKSVSILSYYWLFLGVKNISSLSCSAIWHHDILRAKSDKFDQHLSLYCGAVKPKLQTGPGYLFLWESCETWFQKFTDNFGIVSSKMYLKAVAILILLK